MVFQFKSHPSLGRLCAYYLRTFRRPVNATNKLVDEILEKKQYHTNLISSINRPKSKPRSILKKSVRSRKRGPQRHKRALSCSKSALANTKARNQGTARGESGGCNCQSRPTTSPTRFRTSTT